jgi:hypothetical protein
MVELPTVSLPLLKIKHFHLHTHLLICFQLVIHFTICSWDGVTESTHWYECMLALEIEACSQFMILLSLSPINEKDEFRERV